MRKLFIFGLVCLVLTANAIQAGRLGLVEVNQNQRLGISSLNIPVYWDLNEALLVGLDESSTRILKQNGLQFTILDEEIRPSEYFLVYKAGIGKTHSPGKSLWESNRLCLVKMSENDASKAKALGYETVRLPEHPHPLTIEERSPAPAPTKIDTIIQRLLNQVSMANVRQTILELQNFQTRYTYAWQCDSAASYLFRRFGSLGLNTVYDVYVLSGNTSYNVVATYPGQVHPESIVVACGHFDSYSSQPYTSAPGADDDASGVAAALEIARVLNMARFRWTVKYLAFSGEEQWMKGSYHWVDSVAVPQGLRIAGVYNLDMIGYPAYDSNLIYVTPNTASRSLAVLAESVNNQYGLGLRAYNYLDEDAAGDHTPFWEKGYKAVFVIEDSEWGIWNGSNPHYHTTHDTIGFLKMSLVYRTTKLTLACLATLAGPMAGIGVAEIPALSVKSVGIRVKPNPMKGRCIIDHPWLQDRKERLAIYDASGKLVREFKTKSAKTIWDGRNMTGKEAANGVYLIRFESGKQLGLAKIVVLR